MKSKKIWYCHPTAGHGQQSMSFRPYYLAKYWKQAGHQPYIISSSFHHLLNHPTNQKEAVLAKSIENVDYIFLKTTKYNSNGVKRIFSMLSYSLRFLLQRKQQFKDAIKYYDKVIKINSFHVYSYYNKAVIEALFEKYSAAIALCDKIITLNPMDAKTFVLKGVCAEGIGNKKAAKEYYLTALKIDPNYPLDPDQLKLAK